MKKKKTPIIVLIIATIAAFILSLVAYPSPQQSTEKESSSSVSSDDNQTKDATVKEQGKTEKSEKSESSGDKRYDDGHIVLHTKQKRVAKDPYLPTVESRDDQRYTFPCTPPNDDVAEQMASYAVYFFPYETEYICSYNQAEIDGEDLDFYEYYDKDNLTLLCILTKDSEENCALYDVTDNSYTPITIRHLKESIIDCDNNTG